MLTLLNLLRLFRWAHVCAASLLSSVAIIMIAILVPGLARADDRAVAPFVGRQAFGLPGLGRVAVASDAPRGLVGSAGLGYAWTEAQANEVGAHHRLGGSVALAVQPLRFLSAALMLDGRWEKHPDDALGSSSTTLGEPRLFLRAARGVTPQLALGGQVEVLVPGAEAPSLRPDASRVDARALATVVPEGTELAIALNVGYRRDGTANILDRTERARLRRGDRLTLGLSDFDAIVFGIGASKRLGSFEPFGELGWDVLVGANAPAPLESPLHVGAGSRYHLGEALQLEGRLEVGLSARPRGPELAPIEPRIAALLGLRWILPFDKSATVSEPVVMTPAKPEVALVGSVHGIVKSDGGAPIASAHVTVTSPSGEERAVDAQADGTFQLDEVKPGKVRVAAKAAGFDDNAIEVDVQPKKTAAADLVMKRTIKPGSLRGLVRSFSGKALAATIRIDPIGTEVKADTDGTFAVDVAPGAYEVSITAPGFAAQKIRVQVEENGVLVINADLRPGTGP